MCLSLGQSVIVPDAGSVLEKTRSMKYFLETAGAVNPVGRRAKGEGSSLSDAGQKHISATNDCGNRVVLLHLAQFVEIEQI